MLPYPLATWSLLCLTLALKLTAAASATVNASSPTTPACPVAGCHDRHLNLCSRAGLVSKRCPPGDAAPSWCRCCRDCPARVRALAAGRRIARRRLRKRLRRVVRQLSAAAAKRPRNADRTGRRDRLIAQLLKLELQLLRLGDETREDSAVAASAGWTNNGVEQKYFVDEPATAARRNASTWAPTSASPTSGWVTGAGAGQTLAWMGHLEEQRTQKVKDACRHVSCDRAKGELCLTNIQDLPVCRCVTNLNCANERRRLKLLDRRGQLGRRERRKSERRKSSSATTTAALVLRRQFSGRVCAHLSGFPTERTYQSLCHLHADLCASDSQVLRSADGACANHDPESEALARLTSQKCARCQDGEWRGRGCRRWRRKCQQQLQLLQRVVAR